MNTEKIKKVLGEEFYSFIEDYEYKGNTFGDFDIEDGEDDEFREFINNAYSDFIKECASAFLEGTAGRESFWSVDIDIY